MNLMDWVQITLLIALMALLLKPVWQQWLPPRWNGLLNRLLPARALKSEGQWTRQSPKTDKKMNEE